MFSFYKLSGEEGTVREYYVTFLRGWVVEISNFILA